MTTTFKDMTNFIIAEGAADIPHTKKTYLAHAISVYNDLKAWGSEEDVCRAGMFHSIYGTETFQGFTLALERRDELRALIGERAEQLAYWNCAMVRASLDANTERPDGPFNITDRLTGETIDLSTADYDDLCRIHLCDFLEQVARSNVWNYRREAGRKRAERLGGTALAAYDRVFADEPSQTA